MDAKTESKLRQIELETSKRRELQKLKHMDWKHNYQLQRRQHEFLRNKVIQKHMHIDRKVKGL